ncbi:beta-1,3-galactosyl-O-glycosyl-glycoprotein beta-1,6-N-acetylglucosaminyltransferase-like [Mercenaria mercenaria]|uniref:beta-1,3-galactosyl-O-glycosyl-glycoprotein beta-1,6-N-acetylglucosaminyltransferase-like n=1 Tax=Mercenaria mercenaria TaxID=6596 RepID=UPI00234FA611|nr:beta-1,3-galactosyl-O-glycosyl-glycoprotein beta-1,6-N-acetylglucosaminyltransferase-like [Mercenaria mercenaria]XP_053373012.1 beta-1,3-galactosyl-O-glycosyl-glycoprotein beta-1,6-N-acetylglucosaminyltransferase-like [Mercenaria mercenaria]
MDRYHNIYIGLTTLTMVVSFLYYFVSKTTNINQQLNYPLENIEKHPIATRKTFKLTNEKEFKLKEDAVYRKQVFMANYRPIKNSAGINCTKIIIYNDKHEISNAQNIMTKSVSVKSKLTPDFYLNITNKCDLFRDSRGYIEHPLSKTEFEFPVAFSILVYKDIEQVERLLRSIYRPHNFYCIHIDSKVDKSERKAVEKIADCLHNVFIAGQSVDVKWGDFTLLEAELACMKTLWAYKQWKYYINLAGQEFPLKTNREIVAILKSLEGANVVDGSLSRARKVYPKRWRMAKWPPPHKIQIVKGSMHIAVNRHFVDFCLHDPRSHKFLTWLRPTEIPDETFFPSLNHNPHLRIKGSFLGEAEQYPLKPFFLRHVIWQFRGGRSCSGKFVREVCILGVGDLHRAYNSIELFANKFYLDFEHIALDCLEELLYERTWKEYIEDIPIDTSYYKHLHYAKMQLKP